MQVQLQYLTEGIIPDFDFFIENGWEVEQVEREKNSPNKSMEQAL